MDGINLKSLRADKGSITNEEIWVTFSHDDIYIQSYSKEKLMEFIKSQKIRYTISKNSEQIIRDKLKTLEVFGALAEV